MSAPVDDHPNARWSRWRTCPNCGDYHVRFTAAGDHVRATCEQCGNARWLVCPGCGERPGHQPMVWANGAHVRRAWCAGCNKSRGEWFLTSKPWKRQRLAYIVRERTGECARCGVSLRRDEGEVHHIVPLCAGGADIINNLQRLCVPCHDEQHPWRVAAFGLHR